MSRHVCLLIGTIIIYLTLKYFLDLPTEVGYDAYTIRSLIITYKH